MPSLVIFHKGLYNGIPLHLRRSYQVHYLSASASYKDITEYGSRGLNKGNTQRFEDAHIIRDEAPLKAADRVVDRC